MHILAYKTLFCLQYTILSSFYSLVTFLLSIIYETFFSLQFPKIFFFLPSTIFLASYTYDALFFLLYMISSYPHHIWCFLFIQYTMLSYFYRVSVFILGLVVALSAVFYRRLFSGPPHIIIFFKTISCRSWFQSEVREATSLVLLLWGWCLLQFPPIHGGHPSPIYKWALIFIGHFGIKTVLQTVIYGSDIGQ